MQTSNKILLGGLIVLLIAILVAMIGFKAHYENQVENQKQSRVEQTRNLKSFVCINAKGDLSIEWTQDASQKVTVEADTNDISKVRTNVQNGCLNISAYELSGNETGPVLRINSDSLTKLTLAEHCEFNSGSDISVEELKITMHSNSEADLSGKVQSALISCSSESELDAKRLRIEECDIETSSGAVAEIYASKKLDILAKSNSRVEYSGNPETVNINTEEDGEVEQD